MKIYKLVSLLAFLIFNMSFYGQKIISGRVLNSSGAGVPSASVTIEPEGKEEILAYGITNPSGEFKISVDTDLPKLSVKVKAFNYKTEEKVISAVTQSVQFKVTEDIRQLKEVVLKAKMITQKGDTISYDIKSFENKSDRSLADVMRNMPGVEVKKDGSILFQGKAISKFYVNGKDLMEGGYGIISNALPKGDVTKVEILQNHQPLKILRDKVPTEDAAVNVVLKKATTMTGRGEVGVGLSPFLWNIKLTPMFFGKNTQWVVNYKTNNSGENLADESNMMAFGNRYEGFRRSAAQNTWLSTTQAATPPVDMNRYLFNTIHSFSANILTSPFKSKEWEVKANTSYVNNAIDNGTESRVTTLLNGLENTVTRSILTRRYTDKVRGELIFLNNSEKNFFKNTTTWNGFWQRNQSDVRRISTSDFLQNQSLRSPSSSIENSLSSVLPVGKQLINIMSYLKYQQDTQDLQWNSDPLFGNSYNFDAGNWHQQAKITELTANHSASYIFSLKNWTFSPRVGLDYTKQSLQSQFYANDNAIQNIKNDQIWTLIKPYGEMEVNYKGDNLNASLSLPLSQENNTIEDRFFNKKEKYSPVVFSPSLFAYYNFASFFKLSTFASRRYNTIGFGELYYGTLFSSPTNLGSRIIPLQMARSESVGTSLDYKNPLNNVFSNVRYSYTKSKRNFISTIIRDQNLNVIIGQLELVTRPVTQSFTGNLGKYFPKIKTNASVNFAYLTSNSFSANQYLPNPEILLRETENTNTTYEFKFSNNYFKWFTIDYILSASKSKSLNKTDQITRTITSLSQNLSAFVYPLENHSIGVTYEDSRQTNEGEKFGNRFLDLAYQYTWEKRKMDFELKWFNILNTKEYDEFSVSGDNLVTSRTHYNLRPSQVMLSIKFNFK